MSDAADRALDWRKLDPSARARALRRWCERIVADGDALSKITSECIAIDAADALQYDLAALAAALDELATVAPSALQPSLARRWLGGEPIARRLVAPEHEPIAVPARTLLAPSLAWCATLLASGASVTLSVAPESIPAVRALLDRARREDALPVELASNEHAHATTPALAPPWPLRAPSLAAPSLAWIDDGPSAARALPSLVRAARYARGAQRGALRWVAAKPTVIDALFAALGAPRDAQAHEREGVRWARDRFDPAGEARAMHVCVESVEDEQAFVARAVASGPFAAACAFGADRRRARSIALRSQADAVYLESTPADALGGAMRADFDARGWLAHATRELAIVNGPVGALARVEDNTALRARWLRAWLRLQLGRYGFGGSVEDLW